MSTSQLDPCFEAGFSAKDPLVPLRNLAKSLSAQGLTQREVYCEFLAQYQILEDLGREREQNLLGDVMDMIVDEYPPFNLGLPK